MQSLAETWIGTKKLRRALLLIGLLLPLTGFAGCPPTEQESCESGNCRGGGESGSGSSSGGYGN
jgi:uncharacterized membrane protein